MFRFIFVFLLASTSFITKAECASTGCVDVYVDTLYVNASGVIYIATSGDEKALSCAAASDRFATLNITEPGASVIYSTLLSAQMANKKVQIRTADNSSGCNILYVTLDRQ